MKERVTLAHLSDLHLVADPARPRTETRLFGRLRGMNGHFRRLLADPEVQSADLVMVTGDVTDHGLMAEWEVFWEAVETAGLGARLFVIPGNHDVCCLDLVRRRPLSEDWARMRCGLRLGGQETEFPAVRRVGRGLALFAIDSTNGGNCSGLDNAVGRLGREQLSRLGRSLLLWQQVPHKLILLHHSPNIPRPATSRRRRERPLRLWERRGLELDPFDRRCLRLLAAIFGVKAILHGHTHDALDRTVGGVRLVGAPASTEPDRRGALCYKVHHLYLESGLLRCRERRIPSGVG